MQSPAKAGLRSEQWIEGEFIPQSGNTPATLKKFETIL